MKDMDNRDAIDHINGEIGKALWGNLDKLGYIRPRPVADWFIQCSEEKEDAFWFSLGEYEELEFKYPFSRFVECCIGETEIIKSQIKSLNRLIELLEKEITDET